MISPSSICSINRKQNRMEQKINEIDKNLKSLKRMLMHLFEEKVHEPIKTNRDFSDMNNRRLSARSMPSASLPKKIPGKSSSASLDHSPSADQKRVLGIFPPWHQRPTDFKSHQASRKKNGKRGFQ